MPHTDDSQSHKRKRKKEKREKQSKRSKSVHDLHTATKLLSYAAEGKNKKLEKLLGAKTPDVNLFNAEGRTALHQAAKFGNTEAVALLLRHAADSKAEDFFGNTPAHLAAASQHILTLTELLQADDAPGLEAANAQGTSIRQLMQAAIQARVGDAELQHKRSQPSSSESEDAWQQKLQDNAGFDDFEAGPAADWDSFEYGSFTAGQESAPCDEETYARRMWEEMNARAHKATRPTATAADAWGRADQAQEQRRRAAAAADASRRILEDEQSKDRAWRQAVLQGDMGARRATYEAKWHVFAMSKEAIKPGSVPWLVEDKDDARAVILHGTTGAAEERKRIRLELMRWHPDKFFAKFGKRIATDKEKIMERVKHTSQMLNGLVTA